MCSVQEVARSTNRGEERGREKQRTLGGKTGGREGSQCATHVHPPPPLPLPHCPARPPVAAPRTGGGSRRARAWPRARLSLRRLPPPLRRGAGDGALWRGRHMRCCGEGARGRGDCCSHLMSVGLSAVGDVATARPGRQGHRGGGCRITATRSGRGARCVAGAGGRRQRGAARHQSREGIGRISFHRFAV